MPFAGPPNLLPESGAATYITSSHSKNSEAVGEREREREFFSS